MFEVTDAMWIALGLCALGSFIRGGMVSAAKIYAQQWAVEAMKDRARE